MGVQGNHPRKILEIYMQNSAFSCILSAYEHPKISKVQYMNYFQLWHMELNSCAQPWGTGSWFHRASIQDSAIWCKNHANFLSISPFGIDIEWNQNFAHKKRHPQKILEIYMKNSTFSCILSAYDHPKNSQNNILIILSNDTQTLRPSCSVRELCTLPIAGDRNSQPLPKNSLPLQPL